MDIKSEFQKTVDVKLFFSEVTRSYAELAKIINHFSQNLANYTPQQILSECDKIQNKREELSLLDQQLHEIVQLTSTEIQQETFVDDYRVAFNKAIKACDDLHTNLLVTKAELLSPSSSSKPN